METQELYCHACNRYVQFNIDTELNGQHIIKCSNCGHEHYRYVYNGRISDRRWGSSNQPSNIVGTTYNTNVISYSASSISTSSTGSTINWTFSSYAASSK